MARQIAEDINAEKKQAPGKPMAAETNGRSEYGETASGRSQPRHAAARNSSFRPPPNRRRSAASRKQAKALQRGRERTGKRDRSISASSPPQQNLNKNNPGEAAPQQDRAAAALAKAAENAKEAANPNGDETAKQEADRLEKTAQDLHNLAKQQKDLANQTGAETERRHRASSLPDQQKNLQNQTKQAQTEPERRAAGAEEPPRARSRTRAKPGSS